MAATHIGGLLPDLLSADNARRISAEAQYHSLPRLASSYHEHEDVDDDADDADDVDNNY